MKNVAKKTGALSNASMIALLNQSLADMLALKINAKQAHWNVKGENFISLHELFDKLATDADGYADTLAERVQQLGGYSEGSLAHITKRAAQANYVQTTDSQKHVKAIANQVKATADSLREAIDTSDNLGDKVTADIYTQITGGLDKWHWFISSHQS